MSPIKTFLFGGDGWATVWYLIHYLLLWPLGGFDAYFRDCKRERDLKAAKLSWRL